MKHVANALLIVVSILVSVVVAEGVTRVVDGLPLFTDWLPNTADRDVPSKHLDEIERAPGVSRSWFFSDPPPLPNRHEPPKEWVRLVQEMGKVPAGPGGGFRPEDMFKAWNTEYLANRGSLAAPCDSDYFRDSPGPVFAYAPVDGGRHPRFRFLPNATTPMGLVTNEIGWRGPPVRIERPDKVVRIVFVGASTVANSHYYPYSYPEFIGPWLNLWAAARGLDVRFETLNAGREAITSIDIEAIVRTEVLPLDPDLVVYYEGGNEFDLRTLIRNMPAAKPARPDQAATESVLSAWLRDAANRSALARRFQAGLGMVSHPGNGAEWPKPDYEIVWPADERDPDIARADLPLNLSPVLSRLDRMRTELARSGGELALSSFIWLVWDGMVVDPVRHRFLLEFLNTGYPFRYRDIERASDFQNRVLAKYAAVHRLPFLDVAKEMPKDPDLFTDAVHLTYGGVRLQAWIDFQMLVRLAETKLAQGAWPRPAARTRSADGLLFTPHAIAARCRQS